MTTSPTIVPLDEIQPNPYQPRQGEDPDVVAEIAVNIHRNGLMQIPSARQVNGSYQLVFGHTRVAAYQLLAVTGVPEAGIDPDPRFNEMPLYIHTLDDRQMFEMSVAENIKRRDLNAIEQAHAMQRYMDEFEANSEQAAELFGVKAATVRGKVRLLDLPEAVQSMVADGSLSESASRRLLTLQRAAPTKVNVVAEKLANTDSDPDVVVSNALMHSEGTLELWPTWRDSDETPLAGSGNWPIILPAEDFPMEHLPALTPSQAEKILGDFDRPQVFKEAFESLTFTPTPEKAEQLITEGAPADMVERILHLITPPACKTCPFYVRIQRGHYCTLGVCHKRKVAAWGYAELAKLSEELGIPVYDRLEDGRETYALGDWHRRDEERRAFEEHHADLRLRAKPSSQYNSHDFTSSRHVQVIWVGKKAERILAAKKADRVQEDGESWEKRQARWELQRQRENAIRAFLWSNGTPVFATALEGLDQVAVLEAVASDMRVWSIPDKVKEPGEKASKKVRMAYARQVIAYSLLVDRVPDDAETLETPIQYTAQHFLGVARTWGVPLPADWLEQAQAADQAFEAAVSAETA